MNQIDSIRKKLEINKFRSQYQNRRFYKLF